MGLLPRLQEATLFQFLDAISKLLNEDKNGYELNEYNKLFLTMGWVKGETYHLERYVYSRKYI